MLTKILHIHSAQHFQTLKDQQGPRMSNNRTRWQHLLTVQGLPVLWRGPNHHMHKPSLKLCSMVEHTKIRLEVLVQLQQNRIIQLVAAEEVPQPVSWLRLIDNPVDNKISHQGHFVGLVRQSNLRCQHVQSSLHHTLESYCRCSSSQTHIASSACSDTHHTRRTSTRLSACPSAC